MWEEALKIFIMGFGGVYVGLCLLTLAVQIMSFIIRRLEKK